MSKTCHYVYRLDSESGQFYFGSRTSKVIPENDGYMGSGVWPIKCKKLGIRLKKTILCQSFKTRKEASEHEVDLIASTFSPLNMNISMAIQNPNTDGKGKRNLWADLLNYGIIALGNVPTILYVELIGLADDQGISNFVLASRAKCTVEECNSSLLIISQMNLGPLPQIYTNGSVWKVVNGNKGEKN